MAKIVIVAQVEDPVKWEKGFRTHGDLFKSQTITKPVGIGIEGNQVAVCFEPEDLAVCLKGFESEATAEAMKFDGVLRETVKIFVLDKSFEF